MIGAHPALAASRPASMDPTAFAATTVLLESLVLLPLATWQSWKSRAGKEPGNGNGAGARAGAGKGIVAGSTSKSASSLVARLVVVGAIFAFALVLYNDAVARVGPVTTAVVTKVDVVLAAVTGAAFLGERLSKGRALASLAAAGGAYLALAKGALVVPPPEALVVVSVPVLWLAGHALAKPLLSSGRATPAQLTCARTLVGAALLLPVASVTSAGSLGEFLDPPVAATCWAMAVAYAASHLLWYGSLARVDLSTTYLVTSTSVFFAAAFALAFLGMSPTWPEVLGALLTWGAASVVVRDEQDEEQEGEDGKATCRC
ncbi:MAG: hypothetical protein Kow0069_10170 [Promethearchaeota archaeon]